ncbi:MAG TPA: carboxylesterase/lipase family protein [Thermomonospora sp.]|nr:carboxylesterase/lipase family protein [Thermomonospora sp.]
MGIVRIAPIAAAVIVAAGLPAFGDPAAADPSPLVRTDKGVVRGEARQGHRLFQGIPFAAPPVGALRWRPPQPARPWKGVYDATSPRSQCAQLASPFGGSTGTYGEDCLYLNVTVPEHAKGRRLPVMVWIHGGDNVMGNGSIYNAAKLARQGGVVVVTINYRLGVLGGLAHPGLETGPDRRLQAGNYGLLDQQAALRWVRRNITAFGGNPGNVTVFGESAGSANTCANLASPVSAGLFHRAIPQSYACDTPTRTEAKAEADAVTLAKAVGCETASPAASVRCLRALPARRLMEAFQAANMGAYPVAGGDHVLPLQPREAIRRGRFNRVPVMHGNTMDEMRLFVGFLYPRPITVAQYEGIVRELYGAKAGKVLARYPASRYSEPRIALATLMTDAPGPLSTCSHSRTLGMFARAGVPTYGYQFADRTAPPLLKVPGFPKGAEHGTELTYLFHGLLGDLNAAQRRLSDRMVAYWTSFAHHGRPIARHAPHWPRFRTSKDVLSLAPGRGGIRATDTAARSHCGFWASIGWPELAIPND